VNFSVTKGISGRPRQKIIVIQERIDIPIEDQNNSADPLEATSDSKVNVVNESDESVPSRQSLTSMVGSLLVWSPGRELLLI
jgi:hypothetical protein